MSLLSLFTGNQTSFNTGKDNIERINGTNFIFNVLLFNGTTKIGLKFAAIDNLSIVDDLKYFYCYGKLTFSYNNEALEAFESLGDTEPGGSSKQFEPYVFRGDGRDLLLVEIMPQMKDNECLEISATESEKKDYCIKHYFSIYHYEDKTDSSGLKRRTLYFWDRDLQYLKNITLNFSTDSLLSQNAAVGQNSINVNSAEVDVSNSTQNNSVYTGDAIKGVLTQALQEQYNVPIKFGEWDAGACKINYTSPAQHKAVDDVDYLITYHVSTDDNYNLPCLLKKERYTEKYELKPLNKYYEGSSGNGFSLLGNIFGGLKKVEDFYLGKLDPSGAGGFGSLFSQSAGAGKSNISDYNLIDNYSFQKINSKEVQEYFTSYAVHTNDPRGYFRTDLKNNNYEQVKKLYDKVFVKGNSSGGVSNVPDNKIRQEQKNTQHVFVPYALEEKQRKSFGINRSMLNLFFKNTTITFNVRGNTIRKTGLFFTINRRDSATHKTYDSNLLGQYLITYVRHEFKGGTYTNTIMGTKPDSLEDPKFAKAP